MMPVIISLTTHESLSTPAYTMRRQQQGGYMQDQQFVLDIKTIRERARREIENGAVTPGYKAKTPVVLRLLNDALATELVCILRYKRHYFMAQGLSSESVKSEFLEHAKEEQEHADAIAERIVQLGGQPNLSPEGLLDRSHSQYAEGTTLLDMIKEDLVAERIAIDSYRQMIEYIGGDDPTTRRLLEEVTAKEEEHAEDLASLLAKS
jgi:bacterioferritin